MTDLVNQINTLEVPRGNIDEGMIRLDMMKIYEAESRISETKVSNPATAAELVSVFNEACNAATKYITWIKYEILKAKRNYDLAKATVIIDILPAEAAKLKDQGQKSNTDFREALISRDPECRKSKDIIDVLEATKAFLEAKVKTFERSYWDAKENVKKSLASTVNTSMNMNSGYPAPPQEPSQQGMTAPGPGSFIGTSKF